MIEAERCDAEIRQFRIDTPQSNLDDLQERSSRQYRSPARVQAAEEARIFDLRRRTGQSPRTIAVEVGDRVPQSIWPRAAVSSAPARSEGFELTESPPPWSTFWWMSLYPAPQYHRTR